MLTWSEDFATGSALVDTQHQLLIEKINLLEQWLAGPLPPKGAVDELLDFLGSYVIAHFNFEERCMAHHHCSAQEQNKAAHTAFLQIFEEFREQYRVEGAERRLLADLQIMMSDWIKHHILSVDIKLRSCIITNVNCAT